MEKLVKYFSDRIESKTLKTIGAEIETQFVDTNGLPISKKASQSILKYLSENGWEVTEHIGSLITALKDKYGNKIFYELGRHNIELATIPTSADLIIDLSESCLKRLYKAAALNGAYPYFFPILISEEDLLIIPDERDLTWLKLDGRKVLNQLTKISSVQFTFSISPFEAIQTLNKLGKNIDTFLSDFPQHYIWEKYIKESSAGYLPERYGGPLLFQSFEHYCKELTLHNVVNNFQLVPFENIKKLNIPLYLRSIWWHFRLKRYNDNLCIEARPIPRKKDNCLKQQLQKILDIIYS